MTDKTEVKQDGTFSVVGVGANDFGLLREFLSSLPARNDMAFVVSYPGDGTAKSLKNLTSLAVTELGSSTSLQPNHVYSVPANKKITVSEGEVHLSDTQQADLDNFFRSLAEGFENRLVGLLLASSDEDGLLGLKHVKEHWGITLTHDAELAKGLEIIDLVVPVTEIGQRLLTLGQRAGRLESLRETIATLEAEAVRDAQAVASQEAKLPPRDVASESLKGILELLKTQTGHDFQNYKHPTLLRRIARRLQVLDVDDMTGYLGLLQKNAQEVKGLLHDLLISVTNFFRDEEAFAALERDILPKVFAGKTSTDTVRVWCCGCATGEEAYSLAMLLSEYTSKLTDSPKFQIFASDISEEVIRTAREGLYSTRSLAGVSEERLQRFFIKDDSVKNQGSYRVKKELRDTVLFTLHNVLRDPPFSRLELISCRNVLIYLNRETQEKVLRLFQFALRPGGYLFLGSSESTESAPGLFSTLDKQHRLYESKATATSYGALSVMPLSGRWEVKLPDLPLPTRGQRASYSELHYKLLETLAPPSLLVTEDDTVVHVSEHAGQFLRVSGGEPTRNLFQLVQSGLKLEVQRALFEAKKGLGSGVSRGVPFKLGDKDVLVTIRVQLVHLPESGNKFYLVSFGQETLETPQTLTTASDTSLVEWLEEELQTSREQLRLTIEQYETSAEELRASNEELQALNEELRAASEELETSKEELQSVNEELLTMVDDLKRTEFALRESEAKYRSLFDSIDEGFCITEVLFDNAGEPTDYRFLETNKVFEAQTGLHNPVGKTALQLVPGLEKWWIDTYGKVAKTGEAVRFENTAVPLGRWFDVYASSVGDSANSRVAVVFRDITERKRRELNLEFLTSLEKEVSRLSSQAEMTRMTGERVARYFNVAHCLFVRIDEDAAQATVLHDHHAPGEADLAGVYQLTDFHTESERRRLAAGESVVINNVRDVARSTKAVAGFEALGIRSLLTAPYVSDGRWKFALSVQHKHPYAWRADEEELLTELAEWFYPRLERARAEEALRKSQAELERQAHLYDTTLSTIHDYVYNFDRQGRFLYANKILLDLWGLNAQEAVGRTMADLNYPKEVEAKIFGAVREVFETKQTVRNETYYTSPDGSSGYFENVLSPFFASDGSVEFVSGSSRDVSERKRQEELLRQQQRFTEAILEAAPSLTYIYDLREGRNVFISAQTLSVLGYTSEEIHGFGSNLMAHLLHPDEALAVAERFNKILASQSDDIYDLEYRMRHKNGAWVWLLSRDKVFARDEHGKPTQLLGVATDITERKRSEEALQESEERFRLMADTLPQQVWLTDATGNVIFINRQWYEYSGTEPGASTAAEVAATSLHPDDAPKLMAAFGAAMRQGKGFEVEQRNRSVTGEYRWFLNRAEPYRDPQTGEIIYWFGSGTDIHDLKLAEEALRGSYEFNQEVLDSLDNHIAVLDTEGVITAVNRAWQRFALENGADWTMKGVGVGTNYLEVSRVADGENSEEAKFIYHGISDVIAGKRDFFSLEYPCHSPVAKRWFLMSVSPLARGGAVVSHLNVTERRLVEEALRETDKRKDEFLAVLAHELRNPLAPIRMGVELLKRSTDPAVLQEAKGIIERQSEQLTRLLDDLLDVSRISRGTITLQKEKVELSEIIKLAVESSQSLLSERSHELELSLPPTPVYLEADKTRVTQIILNLLTNAAKYTNPRGKISVSAERQGGEVVVMVEDNGIGIPPDMQTKVFDMFTRVERTETYQQQGLGIGLNLVKQLAELHGGTIKVFSAGEGQGSTFTLRLPSGSGEDTGEPPPLLLAKTTVPRRVLVVDDYAANLKTMARMLKLMGHEVVTAEQGQAALELLETFNPDVILLDLNMPGMSGYELAQRIRADLKYNSKKLFALTGYGQPSDVERTKQAGFDDHLIKPVMLEQLEALLAKM